MAPIRRVNKHNHGHPTGHVLALINTILNSDISELPKILNNYEIWPFKRGDLHHWIDVLNLFDGLLQTEANASKQFQPFQHVLVLSILNFSRLLLESCTNRTIYNSYEHLNTLLMCYDLDVVENTLLFLLRPIHRISSQRYKAPVQLSIKRLQTLNPILGPLTDVYNDKIKLKPTFSFYRTTNQQEFIQQHMTEEPLRKKRKASTRKRQSSIPIIPSGTISFKVVIDSTNIMDIYSKYTKLYHMQYPSTSDTEFKDAIECNELHCFQLYYFIKCLMSTNPLQLLRIKLLSTCLLSHLNHDPNEPHFIHQLLQLIDLECQQPPSPLLYYSLYCLESLVGKHNIISQSLLLNLYSTISMFISKFNDSSHLLYILDSVFVLLTHCIYNNNSLLVTGSGLFQSLINTLTSTYEPTYINYMLKFRSCHFIDLLIYTQPSVYEIFKSLNGISILSNACSEEINVLTSTPTNASSASVTAQCIYTKSLLKFVHHLIASNGTNINVRHLLETKIPKSINHYLLNYTDDAICGCIFNIISTFIHVEPTCYPIINDMSILKNTCELLSKHIPSTMDGLQHLPKLFSAICLQSTGLSMILHYKVIQSFYSIYYSSEYISDLNELDVSKSLGTGMEELIRHQPLLKELIITEMINVTRKLLEYKNGNLDEYAVAGLSTTTVLFNDIQPLIISYMIEVHVKYLSGFFQNQQHAELFISSNGILILDLFELEVQYNFANSKASYFLSHVIHTLCESHMQLIIDVIGNKLKQLYTKYKQISVENIIDLLNTPCIDLIHFLKTWYCFIGILSDLYSNNQLNKQLITLSPSLIQQVIEIHSFCILQCCLLRTLPITIFNDINASKKHSITGVLAIHNIYAIDHPISINNQYIGGINSVEYRNVLLFKTLFTSIHNCTTSFILGVFKSSTNSLDFTRKCAESLNLYFSNTANIYYYYTVCGLFYYYLMDEKGINRPHIQLLSVFYCQLNGVFIKLNEQLKRIVTGTVDVNSKTFSSAPSSSSSVNASTVLFTYLQLHAMMINQKLINSSPLFTALSTSNRIYFNMACYLQSMYSMDLLILDWVIPFILDNNVINASDSADNSSVNIISNISKLLQCLDYKLSFYELLEMGFHYKAIIDASILLHSTSADAICDYLTNNHEFNNSRVINSESMPTYKYHINEDVYTLLFDFAVRTPFIESSSISVILENVDYMQLLVKYDLDLKIQFIVNLSNSKIIGYLKFDDLQVDLLELMKQNKLTKYHILFKTWQIKYNRHLNTANPVEVDLYIPPIPILFQYAINHDALLYEPVLQLIAVYSVCNYSKSSHSDLIFILSNLQPIKHFKSIHSLLIAIFMYSWFTESDFISLTSNIIKLGVKNEYYTLTHFTRQFNHLACNPQLFLKSCVNTIQLVQDGLQTRVRLLTIDAMAADDAASISIAQSSTLEALTALLTTSPYTRHIVLQIYSEIIKYHQGLKDYWSKHLNVLIQYLPASNIKTVQFDSKWSTMIILGIADVLECPFNAKYISRIFEQLQNPQSNTEQHALITSTCELLLKLLTNGKNTLRIVKQSDPLIQLFDLLIKSNLLNYITLQQCKLDCNHPRYKSITSPYYKLIDLMSIYGYKHDDGVIDFKSELQMNDVELINEAVEEDDDDISDEYDMEEQEYFHSDESLTTDNTETEMIRDSDSDMDIDIDMGDSSDVGEHDIEEMQEIEEIEELQDMTDEELDELQHDMESGSSSAINDTPRLQHLLTDLFGHERVHHNHYSYTTPPNTSTDLDGISVYNQFTPSSYANRSRLILKQSVYDIEEYNTMTTSLLESSVVKVVADVVDDDVVDVMSSSDDVETTDEDSVGNDIPVDSNIDTTVLNEIPLEFREEALVQHHLHFYQQEFEDENDVINPFQIQQSVPNSVSYKNTSISVLSSKSIQMIVSTVLNDVNMNIFNKCIVHLSLQSDNAAVVIQSILEALIVGIKGFSKYTVHCKYIGLLLHLLQFIRPMCKLMKLEYTIKQTKNTGIGWLCMFNKHHDILLHVLALIYQKEEEEEEDKEDKEDANPQSWESTMMLQQVVLMIKMDLNSKLLQYMLIITKNINNRGELQLLLNKELSSVTNSNTPDYNMVLRIIKALECLESTFEELKKIEFFKLDSAITDNPPTALLECLFIIYNNLEIVEYAKAYSGMINKIISQQPLLLNTSFQILIKHPHYLEFEHKRKWFDNNKMKAVGNIQLNIRRSHIFEDSYHQIMNKSVQELKENKIQIKFYNEDGIDSGGLTREWYSEVSKEIFNPDYALFVKYHDTYQPNQSSWVNPDHLNFYKFIGRFIAKSIMENQVLDCWFTRSFYKHLLGLKVNLSDLEMIDVEYYNSLKWMTMNDITGVIESNFTVEVEEFGNKKTIQLCADGSNRAVTNENKLEYIDLIVDLKLTGNIKEQLNHFKMGFYELVNESVVKVFDEHELELLISGLPEIDVDDWKNNTEYVGYTNTSPQVQWYWRSVRNMDQESLAKLLQFITGTSKVPMDGFKGLQGNVGIQKFQIHKDYGHVQRLPVAHTCFNQLDLPLYESYEQLNKQLVLAIHECTTGFGLA
eukprot:NODE_287_length_11752_cov_0.494036.p1 type:complete len:2554 gc:universal NODE_287_length_11752_cov_0.494036:10993-3332(-)